MKVSLGRLWPLLLILLLGFALRVYQIDRLPFRGDEVFTLNKWVNQPILTTLNSPVVIDDPHPPLAYAIFNFWGILLGDSEFSLRILPTLINTLGIAAAYALGAFFFSPRHGVLMALFWAVHPFQIWHAQDARNYALWSAFSALALWFALVALKKQRPIWWTAYIAVAAIAAYLYYLELLMIAALNLYVLVAYRRDLSRLRAWVGAQITLTFLLGLWFIQGRLFAGGSYPGTTIDFDPGALLVLFLPALNFGRTLSPDLMRWLWVPLLVIFSLGFYRLWRSHKPIALFVALVVFVPMCVLSLVSLRLNVFAPRYILGVVPAFMLVFAFLSFDLMRRSAAAFFVVPAFVLFLSLYSLGNYHFSNDYAKSPDWRSLSSYLHARVEADDVVVQTAADEAFTHYYTNRTPIERLPANPQQPASEIEAVLEQNRDQYRSIWLVANPLDWPNADIGRQWLLDHMQPVRQSRIADLPAEQFMPWQPTIDPTTDEVARFDSALVLLTVEPQMPIEPDGSLYVWVYWQTGQQTETPIKTFLHLTALNDPQPLAQADQHPHEGRLDSTSWPEALLFREVYRIPAGELERGSYALRIGVYEAETGIRLNAAQGDSVLVTTVDLP